MKRRDFFRGLGVAGAALFGLNLARGEEVRKDEHDGLDVDHSEGVREKDVQPSEPVVSEVLDHQKQESAEVREGEKQPDVLQQEFEDVLARMSDQALHRLQRFYRNKHQDQPEVELILLLRQEWKRIMAQEEARFIQHRLGDHPEALREYFKRFFDADLKLFSLAQAVSQRTNVPAFLILGVIAVESQGRADAVNNIGARGLMQLMPETAKSFGLSMSDCLNPRKNIDAGARYLAHLYQRFGQWSLVLAAYGGGEAALATAIRASYQHAGLPAPQTTSPETLRDSGVNIVTVYSREFCRLGTKPSIQYPFFVDFAARQLCEQQAKIPASSRS